ncbi:alpha/beta hydrolase [Streptomyces niveus]|uniref:alpha/beta hydrolase n=1 Tax=Streptomyces niveus TaxID=193462 RepID=UPI0038688B90
MADKPAIVLVHGFWGGAAHWGHVITELNRRGHGSLHAVELPLTSLADDAERTARMVRQIPGPVLLVGHSYGGAVITEAGGLPNVTGLVYVAAFAPDAGESPRAHRYTARTAPTCTGFRRSTRARIGQPWAMGARGRAPPRAVRAAVGGTKWVGTPRSSGRPTKAGPGSCWRTGVSRGRCIWTPGAAPTFTGVPTGSCTTAGSARSRRICGVPAPAAGVVSGATPSTGTRWTSTARTTRQDRTTTGPRTWTRSSRGRSRCPSSWRS